MRLRLGAGLILTLIIGSGANPLCAQTPLTLHTLALDPAGGSVSATLDDFDWLVGHWRGAGLGGRVDEIWYRPASGMMAGIFSAARRDSVFFFELMTLTPSGPSLAMHLKHFDHALVGWEEKEDHVSFALVRVAADSAFFDGLTYVRAGPGTLRTWVAIRQRDGSYEEASFEFVRVRATVASPWP